MLYTLNDMKYSCEILDQYTIDPVKWNELVENSEAGVPFAYYGYNACFKPSNIFYIVVIDEKTNIYIAGITGRIQGILPIIGKRLASIWIESSVLLDCHHETIRDEKINEFKLYIYNCLINYAKKLKVVQVFFNHWTRENNCLILKELSFNVTENATFELNIEKNDIDEIIKSRCRNSIKKANSNGIKCSFFHNISAETFSNVEKLSKDTYKRTLLKNNKSSIQIKSKYFYEILKKNIPDSFIIGIAYDIKKEPISFALVLSDRKRAIYYKGGSDYEKNRQTSASNLLLYDFIKLLKSIGIKYFDLGGVPYKPTPNHPAYGVYKFKESFGGELKVYYSGYYVVNRFKYFLYKMVLSNHALKRLVNMIINK